MHRQSAPANHRQSATPDRSPDGIGTEPPEIELPLITKAMTRQPDLVRERARALLATGDADYARQLLAETIREGAWTRAGLWWELVALIEKPGNFQLIRDLWLASPRDCHDRISLIRAVARAAAVTGHHRHCRTLLRRLILMHARRGTGPLARVAGYPRRSIQTLRRLRERFSGTRRNDDFATGAREALVDLNRAFEDIGLRAFLISGTLLGLVREGGIIGWDKDIDVGVFTEECPDNLVQHFLNHNKFRLGRVDLSSDRLRAVHRNGTLIDIFPHYREGGLRWHDGTATRWWNTDFGLSRTEFLGIQQYIPDDPEKYLDENYGDWRTPEPNFDARIDAPNAEIIDRAHFDSLLYFSLEKAARTNNPVMRQRYIGMLRELGEGDWLDRL